jgi:hypothetical protein
LIEDPSDGARGVYIEEEGSNDAGAALTCAPPGR